MNLDRPIPKGQHSFDSCPSYPHHDPDGLINKFQRVTYCACIACKFPLQNFIRLNGLERARNTSNDPEPSHISEHVRVEHCKVDRATYISQKKAGLLRANAY